MAKVTFETNLSLAYFDGENDWYALGALVPPNDGFCEGQKVRVTVEALEEPSA